MITTTDLQIHKLSEFLSRSLLKAFIDPAWTQSESRGSAADHSNDVAGSRWGVHNPGTRGVSVSMATELSRCCDPLLRLRRGQVFAGAVLEVESLSSLESSTATW